MLLNKGWGGGRGEEQRTPVFLRVAGFRNPSATAVERRMGREITEHGLHLSN